MALNCQISVFVQEKFSVLTSVLSMRFAIFKSNLRSFKKVQIQLLDFFKSLFSYSCMIVHNISCKAILLSKGKYDNSMFKGGEYGLNSIDFWHYFLE